MSDSVRPNGRQPTRLPSPWDSPGKNTGVGCHFLLQCMKVKVKSLSRVRLLATPWTAALEAPPSVGFSRQEYWSGVPSPSKTDTSWEIYHIWSWYKPWMRVKRTLSLLCKWEVWGPGIVKDFQEEPFDYLDMIWVFIILKGFTSLAYLVLSNNAVLSYFWENRCG